MWLVFKKTSKDIYKYMLQKMLLIPHSLFSDTPISLQITLGLHNLSFRFNMVSNSYAIIKAQQAKHMIPQLLCCLMQNETHKVLICPQEKCLLLLLSSLFFIHLKQVLSHIFDMNSRSIKIAQLQCKYES